VIVQEQTSKKSQGGPLAGLLAANATLVAWLVFLGFGSAFLAFFYSHIHYFPELKWEESFTYLAAISIFGGGIVAIYGLLLFVPGWIWSEFLIFDTELAKSTLCYHSGPLKERTEPCFWSISHHLVLPFALLMVALHLALFAGDTRLLGATTIMGLLAVAWYSLREFWRELKRQPLGPTTAMLRTLLVKYIVTADIAALSGITSLFVLSRLVDPGVPSGKLLTICTIGMVVSNFLVAVQFRQKPTRAVVTSIVAAITLMICGETFSEPGASQSERLMASFGVGDPSRTVRLDLTDEGTGLLGRNGLASPDVTLLSRLGEEYLVEGTDRQDARRRVALPKELVTAWSSLEPVASPDSPFSFQALEPARKVADVLEWSLLGIALLWMLWDISKKKSQIIPVFRADNTQALPAQAGPQDPAHSCDAMVLVEINRSVSIAAELGERN
jgi:hypothetical protein